MLEMLVGSAGRDPSAILVSKDVDLYVLNLRTRSAEKLIRLYSGMDVRDVARVDSGHFALVGGGSRSNFLIVDPEGSAGTWFSPKYNSTQFYRVLPWGDEEVIVSDSYGFSIVNLVTKTERYIHFAEHAALPYMFPVSTGVIWYDRGSGEMFNMDFNETISNGPTLTIDSPYFNGGLRVVGVVDMPEGRYYIDVNYYVYDSAGVKLFRASKYMPLSESLSVTKTVGVTGVGFVFTTSTGGRYILRLDDLDKSSRILASGVADVGADSENNLYIVYGDSSTVTCFSLDNESLWSGRVHPDLTGRIIKIQG